MIEETPLYTTRNPLMGSDIEFIVDSNLLLEFEQLSDIPWQELCPEAASITIVVPHTVVQEMDKHKTGEPRLRRRALQFLNSFTAIEDGNGLDTILRPNTPSVRLLLMPTYTNVELEPDRFAIAGNDQLILAEAERYRRDHAAAVFLSDDGNPRRTARQNGIPVARPPTEWRRKEPQDEKDKEIVRLKRQLGAMPTLAIYPAVEGRDRVTFQDIDEDGDYGQVLEQIKQQYLDANPVKSRDWIIRQYGLRSSNPALYTYTSIGVTEAQIARYHKKYDEFMACLSEWLEELPNLLNSHKVWPFQVAIANEGSTFAQDVSVVMSASPGFFFVTSPSLIKQFFELKTKPPAPPRPKPTMPPLPEIPNFFEMQKLHETDPFAFYRKDADEEALFMKKIEFECEKFRHGNSYVLIGFLARDKDGPAGGLITVTASSVNLADPISQTFPLRVETNATTYLLGHLDKRLALFSGDIHEAVTAAIERA